MWLKCEKKSLDEFRDFSSSEVIPYVILFKFLLISV